MRDQFLKLARARRAKIVFFMFQSLAALWLITALLVRLNGELFFFWVFTVYGVALLVAGFFEAWATRNHVGNHGETRP